MLVKKKQKTKWIYFSHQKKKSGQLFCGLISMDCNHLVVTVDSQIPPRCDVTDTALWTPAQESSGPPGM